MPSKMHERKTPANRLFRPPRHLRPDEDRDGILPKQAEQDRLVSNLAHACSHGSLRRDKWAKIRWPGRHSCAGFGIRVDDNAGEATTRKPIATPMVAPAAAIEVFEVNLFLARLHRIGDLDGEGSGSARLQGPRAVERFFEEIEVSGSESPEPRRVFQDVEIRQAEMEVQSLDYFEGTERTLSEGVQPS